MTKESGSRNHGLERTIKKQFCPYQEFRNTRTLNGYGFDLAAVPKNGDFKNQWKVKTCHGLLVEDEENQIVWFVVSVSR